MRGHSERGIEGIAKMNMSCARVQQYTVKGISAAERHNERKNINYSNLNVDPERESFNIHFKDPDGKTYLQILKEKEDSGELSRRGLRDDATVFDEVIFDINTMYFEDNGGYQYAARFYEEAYQYACEKFGRDNIVSAVMHADEINKAATEALGYPVYHYHLHVVAFPVVEKEILWSKRCKDPELVGTVKEVIHQISHSKKWESKEPLIDSNGEPVLSRTGKVVFRKSYSILQDEFFDHMADHGYKGFIRGMEGSTVEHLSSLEYQIEKDQERLHDIQERTKKLENQYEEAEKIYTTKEQIERMGKQNPLTKNYTVSKDDYEKLTALAKEGITSRYKIESLEQEVREGRRNYFNLLQSMDALEERYDRLVERCQPYLDAVKQFPDRVREFIERIQQEIRERMEAEREAKRQREEEKRQRKNVGGIEVGERSRDF